MIRISLAFFLALILTGSGLSPDLSASEQAEKKPEKKPEKKIEEKKEIQPKTNRKKKKRRASSWGEYYFRKGDFRRAVAHLREEVKNKPEDAVLWRHLGSAYGMNNDFSNAIACYEAALRRNPYDLKSLYNLSLMHNFKGDHSSAEAIAVKGISINTRHAGLHSSLGNIYVDQARAEEDKQNMVGAKKKEDAALKEYGTALGLRPNDPVTRFNKGALHYKRKEMRNAEEEYRSVLKLSPKDMEAAGNLAAIYILQSRLKEAEKLNLWIIKQKPDDEDTLENAYFNLGIIYDRQKKPEKALNMYKLALQLAPWDAAAYVNAAVILERLDRKAEALTYWKKYSRLFPASKRGGEIKRRIKILEQLVKLEREEG